MGLSDKGVFDRSGVTFPMVSRMSQPARPVSLLSFGQNTCLRVEFVTVAVPRVALDWLAFPNTFYS